MSNQRKSQPTHSFRVLRGKRRTPRGSVNWQATHSILELGNVRIVLPIVVDLDGQLHTAEHPTCIDASCPCNAPGAPSILDDFPQGEF